MLNKDTVMNECQRLNLGTPTGGSFWWQHEEVWIQYFGEQLYLEDLVTLTQTYNIQPLTNTGCVLLFITNNILVLLDR